MTNSEIIKSIGELNQPVISDYDLQLLILNIHKGNDIVIPTSVVEFIDELEKLGILAIDKDFSEKTVYKIWGKKDYGPGDIACAVDPFAYVSHLSAMEFHGLTDRIPHTLYISTPKPADWRKFADEKMKKDFHELLEDYDIEQLPKLKKIKMEKINGKPVIQYSSKHQGAFKKIEDRSIRVSTVGRTFLDMVRKHEYCGGIRHVIEVYTEYGALNKRTIIDHVDRVDRSGKNIEKARVGYLMEECCGVKDDKLDKWAENVKRGGSKKLDPSAEYSEKYSEKWGLSINV